jgi:acyl carrier protein
MTNKQKYDNVFIESFSIEANQLGEGLEYNKVPTWDSIGHMSMIAACEDAFSIAMETDDVINFSSYNKGIEILTKYGVQL